jgi:hypothetical protein
MTMFMYSGAGAFSGVFLIFGCDIKLHNECSTYPFDGTIGVEFGIFALVASCLIAIICGYKLTHE